jgi:hypothetical protein
MSLILSGTSGLSDVDGSAATPAIRGTDANTGIFFPAADTIAFSEGGVESVRIDASGNVGVGTVAAGITGAARLQVAGSGTTAGMALYRTDAPLVNASICGIDGLSYDGSAYVAGGTINFRAAENWTATNHGTVIQFRTTASGSGGALFEAMRVNSDGNLGIGTVSPAAKLTSNVSGAGSVTALNLINSNGGFAAGTGPAINFGLADSTTLGAFGKLEVLNETASTGSNAYMAFSTRNADVLAEKMRINAAGNVGIGTASPSVYGGFTTLEVGNTSGNAGLFSAKHANGNAIMYNAGGIASFGSTGAYSTTFISQSVERMRLDSSGNLLVGATSTTWTNSDAVMLAVGNGNSAFLHSTVRGDGDRFIWFVYNTNQIGSIAQTGTTSVSYLTTSDYRLKENVAPMTGALAKIAALNPVTYIWKSDGSAGQGFIAHELQAVVPDCVVGTKDALDKDGKPRYQGVDTSFLVATVVAALQELKTEVDSLKAQLQGAA